MTGQQGKAFLFILLVFGLPEHLLPHPHDTYMHVTKLGRELDRGPGEIAAGTLRLCLPSCPSTALKIPVATGVMTGCEREGTAQLLQKPASSTQCVAPKTRNIVLPTGFQV